MNKDTTTTNNERMFLPQHKSHEGQWLPTGLPVDEAKARDMVLDDIRAYLDGTKRFCTITPAVMTAFISFGE
jgi:hypothetical protein